MKWSNTIICLLLLLCFLDLEFGFLFTLNIYYIHKQLSPCIHKCPKLFVNNTTKSLEPKFVQSFSLHYYIYTLLGHPCGVIPLQSLSNDMEIRPTYISRNTSNFQHNRLRLLRGIHQPENTQKEDAWYKSIVKQIE